MLNCLKIFHILITVNLSFFSAAGVRLDSERAYELASKGLVRPEGSSVPIIYSMKCTKLDVPFFDLGKFN